ncbi:hypothetical protein TWF696_003358 [Orbilia brochopaga]|uniref:Uncharacterized protein n=1 Tax=Orbilia brochopaga TaxID=3140254 RepID=A0AAV9U166_9PEZI
MIFTRPPGRLKSLEERVLWLGGLASAVRVVVPYDPNWIHYVDLDYQELSNILADMTSLHKVAREECPVGGIDEVLMEEDDTQMTVEPVLEPVQDRTLNSLTLAILAAIQKLEASISILTDPSDMPQAMEEFLQYGITVPSKGDLRLLRDVLTTLRTYLGEITYLQRQVYEAGLWFDLIADTNEPFRVPAQNLPILLCDMTDCSFSHSAGGVIQLPDGDQAAGVTVTFYTQAQEEFIDRVRELAQILSDAEERNTQFLDWSRQLSGGKYDFSSLLPDAWTEARQTPPTIESLVQAIQNWIRCWYFNGRVGNILQSLLNLSPISEYLNSDLETELQTKPRAGWPWE